MDALLVIGDKRPVTKLTSIDCEDTADLVIDARGLKPCAIKALKSRAPNMTVSGVSKLYPRN